MEARIPFPFDIPTLKRKVAAWKELFGSEPVIRLYGIYTCIDGNAAFLTRAGGTVERIGNKYLTLCETGDTYHIELNAQAKLVPLWHKDTSGFYVVLSEEALT